MFAAAYVTLIAIIIVLNRMLCEIAVEPESASALQALGLVPRPLSPDEVARRLRAEYDVNKRVIAAANIVAG